MKSKKKILLVGEWYRPLISWFLYDDAPTGVPGVYNLYKFLAESDDYYFHGILYSKELNLEHFLIEQDVQNLFGVSKKQLGDLRTKEGLPYIRISRTRRVYCEPDIISWLLKRRYQRGNEVTPE